MTCHLRWEQHAGIIVCSSPSSGYRRVLRCPKCRTRRRFVVVFGGWYGDTLTCCGCGNEWSDGYLMRRLRTDKSKREAIARAKARWATAGPAAGYRRAVDEFRDIYCSPASAVPEGTEA